MKINKLTMLCAFIIALAGVLNSVPLKSHADEPDPLALPCTLGAIAYKTNPITKHDDKFLCEKCGSETCWILQSD